MSKILVDTSIWIDYFKVKTMPFRFFIIIETRYRFCKAVCLWRKPMQMPGRFKNFQSSLLPFMVTGNHYFGVWERPKIFLFYLYWIKPFIMVKSGMSIQYFSGKSNRCCTLPIFFNLKNCTMANLQVAQGSLYEIKEL